MPRGGNKAFLAQQGQGRPSKGKRSSFSAKLSPSMAWLIKKLGSGKKQAGLESMAELVRLLAAAYDYCPDELREEIEATGVVEISKNAPESCVVRDEEGNIVSWIV